MAPCPALYHLGWPPSFNDYPCRCPVQLALHLPTQLTTIEVGPGLGLWIPAGRAARRKKSRGESKRKRKSWFRSKVIILLLSLRRLLPWNGPKWSALSKFEEWTWVSPVRSPSTLPGLVVLALQLPFSSSHLMLLFYRDDLLTFEMDKSGGWERVWSFFSSASFFFRRASGLLSEGTTLSSFLHVLLLSPKFLLGGYCMHWGWLSRCLLNGCHWLCLWLPTFWTSFLQWSGWASLLAGEELLRGIWVSARCMPSSSVSHGFTKSWVGQVALRSPTNRHALVFNANRNEFLYRVHSALSLICTFLVRDSRYGFLATGSPRLTAF